MANAILEDHLLAPLGIFKERVSQSALYAATRGVAPEDARAVYEWLLAEGMTFDLGSDEATERTEAQVLAPRATYVAAVDAFVWVFEISGAVPAAHFDHGYRSARSERQPAKYFPLGGGTLNGVSKPGEVVWSRVYVGGGALHVDLGRATALALPEPETARRWAATTPQWPLMHAVLHGVSRDQMMAKHQANHVQVAYAPARGPTSSPSAWWRPLSCPGWPGATRSRAR